jgi:hypothetical protein
VAEADAVTVGYVYSRDVTYSWHHSMIEMIGWDLAHDQRVMRGGYVAYKCGTDGLVAARNEVVKIFLDEHQAEWLLWLDTDMGFAADTLDRLISVAHPTDRPIVGGLAFTQKEEVSDGMGGWRCRAVPTIFDWLKLDDGQMGFAVRFDYPVDTVTRVAGTGSACVLVHRTVFERIRDKYGPVWYDRVPNTTMGQLVSEDLSFCMRAGTLDIPIFIHTGVRTTHQKILWLAEDDYFGQVALAQLRPPVLPANERTAIIVPVMRRPQNAQPFMDSLRSSGAPLATVYAIADIADGETWQAWANAGARVLASGSQAGTFAEKVNVGYSATEEPWLFLTGDDVEFKPGWLDHLQAVARDGYDVIGSNDLHEARVLAGEHATHMLIRRSYIDERGASWDGPKVLAHEGYKHWFVDQEIVDVARGRGVFAPATLAHVEHKHPLWGLAETDEVYELGQSHVVADHAHYQFRVGEYASAGDAMGR